MDAEEVQAVDARRRMREEREVSEERESADWARTPAAAWDYYNSLTFDEQTALAFVIDQQRRLVREHMAQVRDELKGRFDAC